MDKKQLKKLNKQLDHISQTLNGVCGRIIVSAMQRPDVKEAHRMAVELGAYVDDMINEYMTYGE